MRSRRDAARPDQCWTQPDWQHGAARGGKGRRRLQHRSARQRRDGPGQSRARGFRETFRAACGAGGVAACSSGRALDANTPAVAQAERVTQQVKKVASAMTSARREGGAIGSGRRSRRKTVRARPEWGPACESITARALSLLHSSACAAAQTDGMKWAAQRVVGSSQLVLESWCGLVSRTSFEGCLRPAGA